MYIQILKLIYYHFLCQQDHVLRSLNPKHSFDFGKRLVYGFVQQSKNI